MGAEYQDSTSKVFCLTLPKISVGESCIVSLFSGTGKVWIRRRRNSRFYVENFSSHIAEIFVGESFTVALISRIEKLGIKGGMGIKIFCQKLFVSQCRKFPEGNSLLLH